MIDIERWYNRCLIQLEVDIDSGRADIIRCALSLFAENPSWLAFAIADSKWREQKMLLIGAYRAIKVGRSLNVPVSSATQVIENIQADLLHNEVEANVLAINICYGQRLTLNTLEFLCFIGFGAISDDQVLLWSVNSNEEQLRIVDPISEDIVADSIIGSQDTFRYGEANLDDGLEYLKMCKADFLKYTEAKSKAEAKAKAEAKEIGKMQYVASDFEDTCQKIERGDFNEMNSLEMLALFSTNTRLSEVKVSIGDWINKLIAGKLLGEPMNDGYKALYIEILKGLSPNSKIPAKQLYKIIAQRLLAADEAGSNDANLSARDGVEALNVPTLAIVIYRTDGHGSYVTLKTFSNNVSALRKLVPAPNAIKSVE